MILQDVTWILTQKVLAFAARGKGVVLLQWDQAIEITNES